MKTATRYFLLQIPGWVLTAILLAALQHWFRIPLWIAWGGWALFVIKDIVLFPFLRHAYETKSPSGAERLIGQVGAVTRTLEPDGYIQLGGDLWQARAEEQDQSVPVASRVQVVGADGLVLIVKPHSQPTGDSSR